MNELVLPKGHKKWLNLDRSSREVDAYGSRDEISFGSIPQERVHVSSERTAIRLAFAKDTCGHINSLRYPIMGIPHYKTLLSLRTWRFPRAFCRFHWEREKYEWWNFSEFGRKKLGILSWDLGNGTCLWFAFEKHFQFYIWTLKKLIYAIRAFIFQFPGKICLMSKIFTWKDFIFFTYQKS